MLKLTIFFTNESKIDWNYLRNDLYFDIELSDVATFGGLANQLAVMWRAQLKQNYALQGISWCEVDAIAPFGATDRSYFSALSNLYVTGEQPVTGESFYRYVARFPAYFSYGIPSQHWFRGFVDEGDLMQTLDGRTGLSTRDAISSRFRDWSELYAQFFFDNLCAVPRSGQTPIISDARFGGYFRSCHLTDSHAQTRWRRRLQGNGVFTFKSTFEAVKELARACEIARDWQSLEIAFAPASSYDELDSAFGKVKATFEMIKSYSEGQQNAATGQQTPPVLRFGVTWENIMQAWTSAKMSADKEVEELKKAQKVPYDKNGTSVIDMQHLGEYADIARKILKGVTHTLHADWYNPLAYPNQIPPALRRRLPDAIELAF